MVDSKVLHQCSLFKISRAVCSGLDTHTEEAASGYELVIACRGTYERLDSRGRCVADAATILTFNPSQPYEIRHYAHCSDESLVIDINEEWLRAMGRAGSRTIDPDSVMAFRSGGWTVEAGIFLRLMAFANRVPVNRPANELAYEEYLVNIITNLLFGGSSQSDRQLAVRHRTQMDHREIVETAKRLIAANVSEKLTLAAIGSEVGVSPFHLTRIFRDITGMSLHRYQTQVRLNYALYRLFVEKSLDLSTIALQLGFSSHSHFSATFGQIFASHLLLFTNRHPGSISSNFARI